ncbi:unnamed protein product [Oppiella nova]|uniref:Sphingomyelin phosphodiesterase n=1 Tax=Oppiella nova TaxID=334625 RepID=A0A7R9QR97_9ACAR|nr:unnamed protein product [Oppiella nova]CAG2170991.1 unnamed protein product [Oppiella nova]
MYAYFELGVIFVILCTPHTHCDGIGGHRKHAFQEGDQEGDQERHHLLTKQHDVEDFDTSNDNQDLGQLFLNVFTDLNSGKHDNHSCQSCNKALTYLKLFVPYPGIMKWVSKIICPRVEATFSTRVCAGVIDRIADPLVYVLQNTNLTVPEVCSTLLHPDCMTYLKLPYTNSVLWELPLPKRRPFKPRTRRTGLTIKMLHLTDIHLDLWYTPGSNSQCNEPLCCRSTSPGTGHSAGFWSETRFSCDSPLFFVTEALRHISDQHRDIDFVIWTGDNVPHDVWNTTQEDNLKHIQVVTQLVKKAFAGKPVFPCLGNHDTHPNNMYVPHVVSQDTEGSISMGWLYDTLADDYWNQWIGSLSAKRTFKKGGYYSSLVNRGLKAVVLNNNICHLGNLWIAYDPIDPDCQLKWLIHELDSAERKGLYVIIIGHVPPEECYLSWSSNYMRIVERYAHLIVGTYFGHSHKDEIVVLYNKNITNNETYAVSHGYIGSSLTTYPSLNPGYRIFTLDSTGKPLDFEMYYTNVTENNIVGHKSPPKWSLGYSAKQSYRMDSLSTRSWDEFMRKAAFDDRLADLYFEHYRRFSEAFVEERKSNYNSIDHKRQKLLSRRVLNPLYNLLPNTF